MSNPKYPNPEACSILHDFFYKHKPKNRTRRDSLYKTAINAVYEYQLSQYESVDFLDAIEIHEQNQDEYQKEPTEIGTQDYRDLITRYFLKFPEKDDRKIQLAPDLNEVVSALDFLVEQINKTSPNEHVITGIALLESALFVHDLTHTICVCNNGELDIPCPVCDPIQQEYLKKNQIPLWSIL